MTLQRSLFEALLGDDEISRRALDSVRAAGRGDELVQLASLWRVLPRLRERSRAGSGLGTAGDARLKQSAVVAFAQSTLFWHRAGVAVQALGDAGLPVGVFKGVGAMAALYGSPTARMVSDVDLVIAPDDVERAVTALRAEGFELSEKIDEAGVKAWIDSLRSPMVHLRDLFVSMRDDVGFEVDLHLRFGHAPPPPMTNASLLARRRFVTVGPTTIPVLAPPDMMVLSAYHSFKDLLALQSVVRDLCDLEAWWGPGRSQWSIGEVVDTARAAELGVPMLTSWFLLARSAPGGPVPEGVEHMERSLGPGPSRDARHIVGLIDHLLDDGRLSQGLLSVLSPQRIRRYVAERRRRAGSPPSDGNVVTHRVAGLRRIAGEAAYVRRIAAYRALGRAQRGYR